MGAGVTIELDTFQELITEPRGIGDDNDKSIFIIRQEKGLPEGISIENSFPGHLGQFSIRHDLRDHAVDALHLDQGNPAIIIGVKRVSEREISKNGFWAKNNQGFKILKNYFEFVFKVLVASFKSHSVLGRG